MDHSPLVGASTSAANGGRRLGEVSEPTGRDHVTVDVLEGRELEKLPAVDSHNHDAAIVKGNEERQGRQAKEVTLSLAEDQIRGLLWLEQPGNEVYAKAHSTWEAQDTLFASRIDKKKKQSNSLRNEIYQLFGFYSVFQGVLLTAVAQSSYLHCHNWWSAFFLSLFASVVSIGGIIQKFLAILALEKTIKNESDTRQVVLSSMVSTTFVNKTGINFKLKEGNAGVYRDLAVLQGVDENGQPRQPEGQFTVTLDVHATYREYTVVATGQKTKKSRVLVSSDMCQDNSIVSIILNDATGKFETQCEPRLKLGDKVSQASNTGGKLSNFWKNLAK